MEMAETSAPSLEVICRIPAAEVLAVRQLLHSLFPEVLTARTGRIGTRELTKYHLQDFARFLFNAIRRK